MLYLGECSSGICDEASCINSGTCTASKADSYICLCPLGFKGHHCEEGERVLGCLHFFLLFSVQSVFQIVTSKDVLCYYTDRRQVHYYVILLKSHFEILPHIQSEATSNLHLIRDPETYLLI